MHTGVDLSAETGSPIFATADGVIAVAGVDKAKGNYVQLKHSNKYQTHYYHLSRFAVSSNTTVTKGDIIGYVGSTGKSTGPHLHYEVHVDGVSVDPEDYFDDC